jgi:VanZ family protein
VSRARNFLKYWLPSLLWILVIYGASSDAGSAQHSSRIIAPIVRWLFPHLSGAEVELIVLAVRKCAHLVEYAVLAVLLWYALWKPAWKDPRPWSWTVARRALLLVALYAATDELHQTFVPSRQGAVSDVAVDTCGGAAGLLMTAAVYKWQGRRRTRPALQT